MEPETHSEKSDFDSLKNIFNPFLEDFANKCSIFSNLVPHQAKIRIERMPSYNEEFIKVNVNLLRTWCEKTASPPKMDLTVSRSCNEEILKEIQLFKENYGFEINENSKCPLKLINLN